MSLITLKDNVCATRPCAKCHTRRGMFPDHFRTQEMCNEAVHRGPYTLDYALNQFKTQEMCNKAVETDPLCLDDVPDYFQTQEMCDAAVRVDDSSLQYVPDWFVTRQEVKLWDDYDDCLMMMRLCRVVQRLSKTEDPESTNRERVNAYHLAFIKMVRLVHVRR